MLSFIWWIVIGLVAGMVARFLIPGRQPMGWILTIVLGLIGSVLGGFLSSVIFGTDPTEPGFQTSGLIMSTIGAMILLGLFISLNQRSRNIVGPDDRTNLN